MVTKPVGGRGKKAPYTTSIIRVPDPICQEILNFIETYRNLILSGDEPPDILLDIGILPTNSPIKSKEELITVANKILKQKKSARISLSKLLQVLYDDETINL